MRGNILFALLLFAGFGAALVPLFSRGQSSTLDAAAMQAAELRAEAERNGAVRVVVTLAMAGTELPSAEAIRSMQQRLLAALSGTGYSGLHRYGNVPQLALTARRDALEVLLASPLVATVSPDALADTQSPGLAR